MSDAVIFSPTKGFCAWWDAGPSDRATLEHNLKNCGLEKYTPSIRTNEAALRLACSEYVAEQRSNLRKASRERSKNGDKVKLDKLVRPHLDPKADGYQVVDEERRSGGDNNDYSADFSAKVEEAPGYANGRVTVTKGIAQQWKLQELYDQAKATVGGNAVGKALVDIVQYLEGTTLREIGGVYWMPSSAKDKWFEVINAFQSAGEKNKVYMMQTVMDEQSCRAVTDAIVSEISSDVSKITEDLVSGSLGDKALEARKARALMLHERVKQYEEILETSLGQLHEVITVVEMAASAAMATQDDSGAFNEMY